MSHLIDWVPMPMPIAKESEIKKEEILSLICLILSLRIFYRILTDSNTHCLIGSNTHDRSIEDTPTVGVGAGTFSWVLDTALTCTRSLQCKVSKHWLQNLINIYMLFRGDLLITLINLTTFLTNTTSPKTLKKLQWHSMVVVRIHSFQAF